MIAAVPADALLGISWLSAAALLIACVALLAARAQARAERLRLERWLRGHLHLIRAHCATSSTEAISVVNSLEVALPILGPIDHKALANHLNSLRRERDRALLRSASSVATAPVRKEHTR